MSASGVDRVFERRLAGLSNSREQAIERLRKAAAEKGANAVLAMRYDSGDIGNLMNEVAAYGTAVKITPKK